MTQNAHLQVVDDSELETLSFIFLENPNAEIIKYSPHKRCLLKIEKNGKEYFVKLYPKKFLKNERGQRVHAIGEKLERFANEGKVNFLVPKAVCWESKTRTIWQEKISGEPAKNFPTTGGGDKILFEIGKAIADISKLEVAPPRFFDRQEQLKDSLEFAEKIPKFSSPLQEKLELIFYKLASMNLPAENHVAIHGDMHIDQWLFDGKRLILLDFEDFSLGEVEKDLASFLVQIQFEYPEIDLSYFDSFFEGFRSSGKVESENLIRFYSAHKWIAKAAKDENKAEEILDKAIQSLEFLR